MSKVQVFIQPNAARFMINKISDVASWASKYIKAFDGEVQQQDEDAAEEMFDLTNNPMRQDERERLYGLGVSISTGDVVVVDGVAFLCQSVGWGELPEEVKFG